MLNLVTHILITGPKGVSRFGCVIATLAVKLALKI